MSVPQLMSPGSGAHELHLLKLTHLEAVLLNKRSHYNQKPSPQLEKSPHSPCGGAKESPCAAIVSITVKINE